MTEGNVSHPENPQGTTKRVFKVIVGGKEYNPRTPEERKEATKLFMDEMSRLKNGQEIPFNQIVEQAQEERMDKEKISEALEETKTPNYAFKKSLKRLDKLNEELNKLENEHPTLGSRERFRLRHNTSWAETYYRLAERLRGDPEKQDVFTELLRRRNEYQDAAEMDRKTLELNPMYEQARKDIEQEEASKNG